MILCEGGLITTEHLLVGVVRILQAQGEQAPAAAAPSAGVVTLESAERQMIQQALSQTGNNKSKAARLLGLTRAQLRSHIEKHRLEAGK